MGWDGSTLWKGFQMFDKEDLLRGEEYHGRDLATEASFLKKLHEFWWGFYISVPVMAEVKAYYKIINC